MKQDEAGMDIGKDRHLFSKFFLLSLATGLLRVVSWAKPPPNSSWVLILALPCLTVPDPTTPYLDRTAPFQA
jgi:hypothetical protein